MEHRSVGFMRAFIGHWMVEYEAEATLMRLLFAPGGVTVNKIGEKSRMRIIVCVGYERGKEVGRPAEGWLRDGMAGGGLYGETRGFPRCVG